jgi:uncharacterized protein YneF (UPF0154 family)
MKKKVSSNFVIIFLIILAVLLVGQLIGFFFEMADMVKEIKVP